MPPETLPSRCVQSEISLGLGFTLLTLLTLIAGAPLAYPGFLETHSGFLPIYHAYELAGGANLFIWTPRIGSDFDPWRSDGRFSYWIAALAIRGGLSGTAAVRLSYALALVLGAWGMHVWARRHLSPLAALLAALVYVFLPWTLVTWYVRGALGEAWLWAVTPWLLWGVSAGMAGSRRGWAAAGLATMLLLWSQAGLAAFVLFLALLSLALAQEAKARLPTLFALAIGVAVGIVGLIPWLTQPGAGPNPAFDEHFLYLFQLLLPQWGYDVSRPGWQDSLSFQMGAVAIGLALLAAYGGLAHRSSPRQDRLWHWAGAATGLILLLTLGITAPLWRVTGMQRLLTYPWQLLIVAAPWLSLMAGSAVDRIPGLEAQPRWAVVAGLVVLSVYPYLSPRFTQVEPGARPAAILGENQIALVDAQVTGDIRPGSTLTVTLTWQALKPIELDYTVFVHVVDPDEQIRTQRDIQPQAGQRPTNTWAVGELIRDEHPLSIPADAPAVRYHINLGLYDWRTGQRLRVGNADFIRLEAP
ncbi:MAG: hypothetical protein RML36_13210 [Anaerolineae bacterium]|nr:hypothetical protein [Anaerolineae bacterium]MDW8100432.1 hypothetical protein [Anaerolineae bacterium]